MGKAAFILGVVASVVTGLVLSRSLYHRDHIGSVSMTGVSHPCPTLGVVFEASPVPPPPELTTCACPAPPALEGRATPLHPPADLVAAAAPLDHITVTWTEFTPPFGGKRLTGLSYVLAKGMNQQRFDVSPAGPVYSRFALLTAAPFLAGIVLGILLGLISGRKGVKD